jgi:Skp family chaperone for outer membrane proteins
LYFFTYFFPPHCVCPVFLHINSFSFRLRFACAQQASSAHYLRVDFFLSKFCVLPLRSALAQAQRKLDAELENNARELERIKKDGERKIEAARREIEDELRERERELREQADKRARERCVQIDSAPPFYCIFVFFFNILDI